ncbi:MAG TPA: hypothetical protein VD970_08025 [Acetobacteraceae bacterium]|nr:hypothetical protein [Acetobacteraceae bacterium]
MADARIEAAVARFGWRNLSYLAFVVLCLVAMSLMTIASPRSDAAGRGTGFLLGVLLWGLVTLPFFVWNLAALIAALAKGRPARKPGIGVALPVACVVLGGPVLDALWHALIR